MNTHELARAAGFYDGEGCFTVHQFTRDRPTRTRARKMTMQVSQKGREPLDRFRDAMGCGKVFGPYTNGGTATRDVYRWAVTSKAEVHHAIWMLWHWLSEPKRRQIDAALERYHDGAVLERRGHRPIWEE